MKKIYFLFIAIIFTFLMCFMLSCCGSDQPQSQSQFSSNESVVSTSSKAESTSIDRSATSFLDSNSNSSKLSESNEQNSVSENWIDIPLF